jgi:ABC-2 type transport system ATP-binding protein
VERISKMETENIKAENESASPTPELKEETPKEETPAILIKGLYKSYGKKEVLKGLDLEVKHGELFGFVGKNGVGKSTTIDCMVGVKSFNQGSITLNGFDIKKETIDAKYSFGYVPSEPTCYEVMSGYDYLEFVASIFGLNEKEFRENVAYLSNRLGLSGEDLTRPIRDYSHGMKQKVCLISSLLHNPDIWILDEPTVGLDIMAIEELKNMMKEYATHGKTVFITSHNIEMVAKLCDRIAIINDGKVASLFDLNKEPNRRLQLPRIFMDTYGGNK